MKKKILFCLASGIMALSLATGCGKEPNNPPDVPSPDDVTEYVPDLTKSVALSIANNYNASTGMKYNAETDYTTPAGTVIKKGAFKPVYQKLQENKMKIRLQIKDLNSFALFHFYLIMLQIRTLVHQT